MNFVLREFIEALPATITSKGLFRLLEESITLAMRAETAKTSPETSRKPARDSMLATAQFVDGCANACLKTLSLDKQIATDINNLPTLSKLELFLLLHRPQKKLDRSRPEVKGLMKAKEIISRSLNRCQAEDAMRAMQDVHKFLHYFFKELCGFKPSDVTSLILPNAGVIPNWGWDRFSWLTVKKIDVGYIEIGRV